LSILRLDTIPRDVWHARLIDIYFLCEVFPDSHNDKLYDAKKILLETHVSQVLLLIETEGTENHLQIYYTYWKNYRKGIKHMDYRHQYVLFYLTLCYYIKDCMRYF